MRCENFKVDEFVESLMLEAGGINSGMRTIENYCHVSRCFFDNLIFQEFLCYDKKLQLEDIGLVQEGLDTLEFYLFRKT